MPFKSCTYNCIYCQLGRTTQLVVRRRQWVPVETVLAEVKRKLDCHPDYIALSGCGEPTLYARLGEVITGIKEMTRVPVAVLTNGSLLWQPAVRSALTKADVIIPSLDAGDDFQFQAINRPHSAISFERMIAGLVALRSAFAGQYWLEVMLLNGFTSLKSQLAGLVEQVRRLQPDKVQLNTVVRPPAEEYALPVPETRLRELARLFLLRAEVIAAFRRPASRPPWSPSPAALPALLRRRPCTVDDVMSGLGLKRLEALKVLEELEARGRLVSRWHEGKVYYQAPAEAAPRCTRPRTARQIRPRNASRSTTQPEPSV